MDFTELYAQKKMTADQAAALVKSGDWVDYGWAVNTPVAVDAAIARPLPRAFPSTPPSATLNCPATIATALTPWMWRCSR